MSKIKELFANIVKKVERASGGLNLDPYAKEYADRIKRRTRLGNGLDETKRGAKRKKLKKLSEKYKKKRKRNKSELSSETSPSKSNLTYSGQLLDSITGKGDKKKIQIFIEENRNDGVKNKDILKGQSKQGRDFFELSDKELKSLQNSIKNDLIKSIKKNK